MRRPIWYALALASLLAFLLLLSNQHPADAHGYIIREIPADGATLDHAPSRIQIWFSESLEPRFSDIALATDSGQIIPLTENGVSPTNPGQLTARLPANLPDGAYVATLRVAFASDGHVVSEPLIFWIGSKQGNPQAATSATLRDANPAEIAWRLVALPAFDVLFGVLLLYLVVLLPGWGNRRYKAGGIAPRVLGRLNLLIWTAIILAGASTVAALLQQSTTLFATNISNILRDASWSIVLNGTQIGSVIKLRLILIGLAAAVQFSASYIRERLPDFVTALYAVNMILAAAILGTLSISSHAAGATFWALPSIAVDWLHLLANGAWVGGLITLTVVLPAALSPLGQADRQAALLAVLRRFSVLGVITVALLITTGIYSALLQIPNINTLSTSSYGLTLLVKGLLIIPLLLFGLYHHLAVNGGAIAERFHLAERIANLTASVRLESVIGLSVIGIASVLTATPPPIPAAIQANPDAAAQTIAVSGIQVSLALDPDAAGTNAYEVTLTRDAQPLEGAQVRLTFTDPALDKRTKTLTLDDAASGVYINAGGELERSGAWQALLDITPAGSPAGTPPIRAAFLWMLTDVPPNASSRQANVLNWLSVVAIIGVIVLWLWPGVLQQVRRLDLKPEAVMIGIAASIATLLLLIGGGWVLASATQETDAQRNPRPVVVNPILADASSLVAGQTIYAANCASCHGAPDAPTQIIRQRLPLRRDEDLYKAITNGVGMMPAVPLSKTERWNVINYLRSSAFLPPTKPPQSADSLKTF